MTPTPRLVPDRPSAAAIRYSDDDLRVIVQDWSLGDPDQATAVYLSTELLELRERLRIAAHPSRGVVDEGVKEVSARKLTRLQDLVGPRHSCLCDEIIDAAIKALQAAALPAVPLEESAFMMLRAFSDAAVDAAMTGIGIVKLTGDAGVITATCVPPDSITLAAAPAQEVEGG